MVRTFFPFFGLRLRFEFFTLFKVDEVVFLRRHKLVSFTIFDLMGGDDF